MASNHFRVHDYVLASYKPYDGLWEDSETRKWISMANKSLREMVDVTLTAIRDTTVPKNILVIFFQKYVGGISLSVLRGYVREIVDEARGQNWNKILFSTCWFTPAHQQVWGVVGEFNRYVHRANEAMGMNRVNLHKCLMSQVDGRYDLRTRCAMWLEFQLGLHLGQHLSYEGVASVVKSVIIVLNTAYVIPKKVMRSRETRKVVPPALAVTPGYNKNVFMRQLLADRGLIPQERRSGRRLIMSTQRMPGWKNWNVFQQHGPLRRYNQREGILEALTMLLRRSDPVPVWETSNDSSVVVEDVVVEAIEVIPAAVHEDIQEVAVNTTAEDGVKAEVIPDVVQEENDVPYDPEVEWEMVPEPVSDHDDTPCDPEPGHDDTVSDPEDEWMDDWVPFQMNEVEVVTQQDEEIQVVECKIQMLDIQDAQPQMDLDTEKEKVKEVSNESEIDVLTKKLQLAEVLISQEKEKVKSLVEKLELLEKEVERVNETMRFMRTAHKARSVHGRYNF